MLKISQWEVKTVGNHPASALSQPYDLCVVANVTRAFSPRCTCFIACTSACSPVENKIWVGSGLDLTQPAVNCNWWGRFLLHARRGLQARRPFRLAAFLWSLLNEKTGNREPGSSPYGEQYTATNQLYFEHSEWGQHLKLFGGVYGVHDLQLYCAWAHVAVFVFLFWF